jgi:hypothetical protein
MYVYIYTHMHTYILTKAKQINNENISNLTKDIKLQFKKLSKSPINPKGCLTNS